MTIVTAVSPIAHETYKQLIRLCREALPNEACGVLARKERSDCIDVVYAIRNAHASPSSSFSFDPVEWTTTYYRMQKNRQYLVGFFHSHPRSAAVPSIRDHEAFPPPSELSYWIVSLANRSEPVVQPYRHDRGHFYSSPLVFA